VSFNPQSEIRIPQLKCSGLWRSIRANEKALYTQSLPAEAATGFAARSFNRHIFSSSPAHLN